MLRSRGESVALPQEYVTESREYDTVLREDVADSWQHDTTLWGHVAVSERVDFTNKKKIKIKITYNGGKYEQIFYSKKRCCFFEIYIKSQ